MTSLSEFPSRSPWQRWPQLVLPFVVAIGALWSIVPLPIWLVGTAPSEFGDAWALWTAGGTIAIGLTLVIVIVSGRRANDWLFALWQRHPGAWPTRRFVVTTAILFAALAWLFTMFVAHGNPRAVDGFAQLFQARIFLAGRLWMDPPPELAHFGTLHMVLGPDKWFSQYPPGQSLVLVIGLMVGAWWLMTPLFAFTLVASTYRVARWSAGDTVGRLAVILLCVSPFAVGIAGTEMSHLPAAAIGVAAAACATALSGPRAPLAAVVSGFLLGVMTAFRPLDAVAAALPVACIALLDSRTRIQSFALIFAGGVIGSLPTLWFNAETTGHWLEFGYTHLWGPNHSLGFHDVPFGIPLTPLRAVGLTGLDLHLLNRYLLDLPIPLLPAIAIGYVVGRRALLARDALPILGLGALMGLLFFYWHRDIFYGPRLLYSAMPWIVIIIARALHLLRHGRTRVDARLGVGVGVTTFVTSLVVGIVFLTPARMAAYRDSTPTFNHHPEQDAADAAISNAVVVIPDGWGSRLIARMWQAGIPVARSTRLYSSIDACTLHRALDRADRSPQARSDLSETLDSLAALRRPGTPAQVTEDANLRLPTWEPLAPECRDEIEFDRGGVLAFAPYLYHNVATLDGDIVWARDMNNGNADLATRFPGRRLYRYTVQSGHPMFTEIDPTPDRSRPRK